MEPPVRRRAALRRLVQLVVDVQPFQDKLHGRGRRGVAGLGVGQLRLNLAGELLGLLAELGHLLDTVEDRLHGQRVADLDTLSALEVVHDRTEILGVEGTNVVGWKVTPWAPPPRVTVPQGSWIMAALTGRPEIQARRWELAALGDEAAVSRFALWDTATLGVEAERDVNWIVGPTASTPLPLFDFGGAKRDKAIAAVIEARHHYTQTRRQIVEDVRRAYDTFISTQALHMRTRDVVMPLQERRVKQAEAAYRAGETDLTTLLIAQEELQDARIKLVGLEQKTSVAFSRLQRAVGGPGLAEQLNAPSTQPVDR